MLPSNRICRFVSLPDCHPGGCQLSTANAIPAIGQWVSTAGRCDGRWPLWVQASHLVGRKPPLTAVLAHRATATRLLYRGLCLERSMPLPASALMLRATLVCRPPTALSLVGSSTVVTARTPPAVCHQSGPLGQNGPLGRAPGRRHGRRGPAALRAGRRDAGWYRRVSGGPRGRRVSDKGYAAGADA